MSLLTYALCTLAEAKESLGLTDTTKDSLVTRQINAATELIEKYCNRRFTQTVHTLEEYNGTGTTLLTLKHWPVIAVSLLERNLSLPGDPDWDAVQTDLWKVVKNEGSDGPGQLYYSPGFVPRVRNYRVTYTAGFASIPDDVKEACIDIVAYLFNNRLRQGLRSERLGEYSYERMEYKGPVRMNLIQKLDLDIILDFYRTPEV